MLQQVNEGLVNPLDAVVRSDIQSLKDTKKNFERHSDQSDGALDRYLWKKPGKDMKEEMSIVESAQEVATSRREFHLQSLNYAQVLNDFHFGKRFEMLEHVLTLMYAQSWFFRQGHELYKDMEPVMRELSSQLEVLQKARIEDRAQDQTTATEEKRKLDRVHPDQTRCEEIVLANGQRTKVGYLFKKGSGKVRQVWNRRWFSIKGDYLLYSTRGETEPPTVAANLRLCTVRTCDPNAERRFCFEVISPVKSYVLQAENEHDMAAWIEVLQAAISNALNSEHSADHLSKGVGVKEKLDEDFIEADLMVAEARKAANAEKLELINKIKQLPGNQACCDCGAPSMSLLTSNY